MATRTPETNKQNTATDSNQGKLTGGLKRKPYFYDAQTKRMIVQVLACFAGYQVRTGVQRDGKHHFLDVPIIYGGMDRTVGYLLQGGSENTMAYLPIMSLIETSIRQKREWRQQPQHIEKKRYIERARDSDGKLIVGQPGRRITVERYMPVPYEITFELSIWTSNKDTAFQLLEQIGVVFNPEIDIALSNGFADWAFLTTLNFDEEIKIESIQADGSNADPFTVHSMSFTTTLWLSPPAKVMDTTDIHTIHIPIFDMGSFDGETLQADTFLFDGLELLDKCVIRADEEDILRFETFG
jgi:hypothetical protein